MNQTDNQYPELLLGSNEFKTETFTALGAATHLTGTVLGRLTADDKLVVYDEVAVNGSEVPQALLIGELVTTGGGDHQVRVCIFGEYHTAEVTVHNSGTPRALTIPEEDLLRDVGLRGQATTDSTIHENS